MLSDSPLHIPIRLINAQKYHEKHIVISRLDGICRVYRTIEGRYRFSSKWPVKDSPYLIARSVLISTILRIRRSEPPVVRMRNSPFVGQR